MKGTKLSPAQRRKASCGPAFRQSYIDDGWKAGAPYIIAAFAALRQISEARRKVARHEISAMDARRQGVVSMITARRDMAMGRRLTPLPA
ncbi:hypothetical protein PH562_18780 [Rhizobium sp. CNPSo 4062]|uniref:hypothetical protein n=1 Tax=Rhizobium sp. CNPSo 4062 TaxID=3021410 RepID=UPI0025517105|nr:hypothetical protein [Rhizobium sp. CNPSo 4062]MDK4704305.1 hypothetical protein [Rhizobium sp. CNPSo 4062]